MEEVEQVSRLIGDICDASLDPGLWPAVFEKAVRYVQGSTAFVVFARFRQHDCTTLLQLGYRAPLCAALSRAIRKLHSVLPTILLFGIGETLMVPDFLPREEFCRTRFALGARTGATVTEIELGPTAPRSPSKAGRVTGLAPRSYLTIGTD